MEKTTVGKNTLSLLMVPVFMLFIAACGQSGFMANQAPDLDGGCGGKCSDGGDTDPEEKMELDGEINGGLFSGASVVEIDQPASVLVISLPIVMSPIGEVEIEIPELPGATVKLEESSPNQWFMVMRIPLKYFKEGLVAVPPARLPNGDPLPGIPGGELPKLGLGFMGNSNVAFLYLGVSVAAVYFPTPGFNPYVSQTYPIKNRSRQKTIGYFSLVAEKNGFDGGFYISVMIPDDIARLINKLL